MKIGILSRHSVANYGSLLQAYALQTSIEKMGYEVVNINYTPADEIGGALAKTLMNISRWGRNPFTKILFLAYQYPSFSHTFNVFKNYRLKFLKETIEYSSSEQLKNNLPEVDLFCTGSDQVWNLLYNNEIDDTYFFDFLPDEKKRIAYAASFGGNKFEGSDLRKYAMYLKKYEHISVREDNGIEILQNLGIRGEQVLDPTLLLPRKFWETHLPNKEKTKRYILIYQLRPNREFDDYANELSRRTGLKLIRISTMLFQKVKCGEFHYLPTPEMFLWYIKNADYLLTDSFHGTCFALLFNTNFIEILPGRFNSRNQSLLRTLGVEDRILNDYQDFEMINKAIDYDNVNSTVDNLRSYSLQMLENYIKGV